MKWKTMGRTALAGMLSLAVGLGLTSCSRDYAVAYLYSASAGTGTVGAYAIDYQSGVLTQIAGSPYANGGTNPVALVASPSGKFLYVVSQRDSQVTEFAIGTDGKLYQQHNYNLTGSFGTWAAIDSTDTFLYVTYTYQNGFGPASPGPGGVTIFPINSDGSLGTASNVNVGNNPVSIAVSNPYCTATPVISGLPNCSGSSSTHPNVFVYVLDQEASPNATILGYAQNTTNGALTALSGTTCTATTTLCQGYHSGVVPSSIAVDPTTRYVYVSDQYANQIIGYQITSATTGNLTALNTSPFSSGAFPTNLIIDPRGKYLLTSNYNANTVGSFTINSGDGSLGGTAGLGGSSSTATGPSCVTIEPALGIYVFTSNRLDNSISGLQMNANTGGLSGIANSPFPTSVLPSCVTAVASGSHSQSVVNP